MGKYFFMLVFLNFIYIISLAQNETDQLLLNNSGSQNKYIDPAQNSQTVVYNKPKPFACLTHVPGDLWQLAKSPFQKENLKADAIIAGLTAVLMHFDQSITNFVGKTSKGMKLNPQINYGEFSVHHKPILKLPHNLNSAFYELGEGTTTMGIAGGFFIYGKITHNNRALQTASDLAEAFFTMGIAVQTVKRSAGRQEPFRAQGAGGLWRPFPSFSQYLNNTSNFASFPSGHLATMMATITVLSKNYPEKKWIKPVGYFLMGLTGWSMMNNKVHWASDFPLGLGIGYASGKIAYNRHHKKELVKESLPL
jgi:membrane-associated phospholipid phosphatase